MGNNEVTIRCGQGHIYLVKAKARTEYGRLKIYYSRCFTCGSTNHAWKEEERCKVCNVPRACYSKTDYFATAKMCRNCWEEMKYRSPSEKTTP